MEIQIQAVRFTADEKLLAHVRDKLAKLQKFNDRITSIDVFLKLENSGQIKDKVVEVRAFIPGSSVFVSDVQKTFEAALDKALESLKRQAKKQNDKLKTHRQNP